MEYRKIPPLDPGSTWRHYKGADYKIHAVLHLGRPRMGQPVSMGGINYCCEGINSAKAKILVLYSGDTGYWYRGFNDFVGLVKDLNKPRFERVGEWSWPERVD